jgi:hypothetical protein
VALVFHLWLIMVGRPLLLASLSGVVNVVERKNGKKKGELAAWSSSGSLLQHGQPSWPLPLFSLPPAPEEREREDTNELGFGVMAVGGILTA